MRLKPPPKRLCVGRELKLLPHETPEQSTAEKLTAGPLNAEYLNLFGRRKTDGSFHKLSVLTHSNLSSRIDDCLIAYSGEIDLRRAFRRCAHHGRQLRIIICHAFSRGEALLMGAATWHRSNTDGDRFLSYTLRRAAYETLRDHLNLYDLDLITKKPYHIRLLSALVVPFREYTAPMRRFVEMIEYVLLLALLPWALWLLNLYPVIRNAVRHGI